MKAPVQYIALSWSMYQVPISQATDDCEGSRDSRPLHPTRTIGRYLLAQVRSQGATKHTRIFDVDALSIKIRPVASGMLRAVHRRIGTDLPFGQLSLRAFTTAFPLQLSAPTFAHRGTNDKMANPEAKASRAPAVTLKTPKGTRDWSGQDMLMREEVLYVGA